jgi:hypothetical protein
MLLMINVSTKICMPPRKPKVARRVNSTSATVFADQRFQEDLHTAAKTEDDVEGRLALDAMYATVLELLASRRASP